MEDRAVTVTGNGTCNVRAVRVVDVNDPITGDIEGFPFFIGGIKLFCCALGVTISGTAVLTLGGRRMESLTS